MLKVLSDIKDQLNEFHELDKLVDLRDTEINSLRHHIEELTQSLVSKDHIIQTVEQNYMEQIDLVNQKNNQQIQEKMNNYQAQIEQLGFQIQDMNANNEQLREKIKQQELQISYQQRNSQNINEEYAHLKQELARVSSELESFKDIRTGSLIIKKIYNNIVGDSHQKSPNEHPIFYLFTCKFRNQMIKFFQPTDLLSLMLVNRKMYFLIRNNRTLITHLVTYKLKKYENKVACLEYENNYFNEMAERIPDEVLQQAIAKFLAFKFHAGSYMNDVFKDAFDLIEGRSTNNVTSNDQEDSTSVRSNSSNSSNQQYQNMFDTRDLEVQNEDLIGLNSTREDIQIDQKPVQSKPLDSTKPVQQSSSSIFQKFKNLTSQKPPQQHAPKQQQAHKIQLSDLALQLQTEMSSFGEVFFQALQLPFLRYQIQQTRQDMSELIKRTKAVNQQLFQAGQSCIPTQENPNPKYNIQNFMHKLQFTFSRLLTHSHYLSLECQQLQNALNFICHLLQRQNKQIQNDKALFEDTKEEIKTLREMNVFLQGRTRQLEERVHKGEEEVLYLGKEKLELDQQNRLLGTELREIKEQQCEYKEKIRLFAATVKNLNHEKIQLSQNLKSISIQFQRLKIILPKIDGQSGLQQ